MNILALDLGTKCGYACSRTSGVWDLKAKTTESIGERYRKFKVYLERMLFIEGIDFVVYEKVHAHSAVEAAHVFGGLQAILQTTCLEANIEYKGIGVGEIKKHATGKGNADKDMMLAAAIKKFKSINVQSFDHADALWLLDLATNQANLTKS